MPAPMRRLRPLFIRGRSARSGRCPSRVWKTWKPFVPHGLEDALDRLDGGAGEREIVAHLVHVTSRPAEIRLHVDDDEDGVLGPEVAVVRPRVWICFYVTCSHGLTAGWAGAFDLAFDL